MNNSGWFISTGRHNAQYTLRCKDELLGCDFWQRNLGRDLEKAKQIAFELTGEHLVVDFSGELSPYRDRTEENRLREERISKWKERQAEWDKLAEIRANKIKEENKLSKYQGEIGSRIDRELTCITWKEFGFDKFGEKYVGVFKDSDCNKYVYFGSMAKNLPRIGETCKVSFFVGNHRDYQDCKQTTIKRPIKVKE